MGSVPEHIRASCMFIRNHKPVRYEECTMEEWDNTSEYEREFINFKDGRGYIFARPAKDNECQLRRIDG